MPEHTAELGPALSSNTVRVARFGLARHANAHEASQPCTWTHHARARFVLEGAAALSHGMHTRPHAATPPLILHDECRCIRRPTCVCNTTSPMCDPSFAHMGCFWQVAAVRQVLDGHFPRCKGTVVQGDNNTRGICGCEGTQHWYSPAAVAALLFTFYPSVYVELCGSVGKPIYEKLNRCLQQIEGEPLWLGRDSQRRINREAVRNAIYIDICGRAGRAAVPAVCVTRADAARRRGSSEARA